MEHQSFDKVTPDSVASQGMIQNLLEKQHGSPTHPQPEMQRPILSESSQTLKQDSSGQSAQAIEQSNPPEPAGLSPPPLCR
ncbi:hypothetical protein CVT26_003864 [Gymnopilus dilepis]|uniref:Uncharacterized protein n=1 Tax=Gymnopilus dilepis TaxID=231916 RepID=A0A409YV52_9AGAR|nr:hypothetical protein CVT26_003864 [Gymnopilus dilepis]